ncbi:MAG: DUF4389 domain-containing protein [Gammaproteobacteria bacterium]|nr:DUF4389 domain-containing protein [Gammaproteobacteria bacterium]
MKEHLLSGSTWLRGFFIVMYTILFHVAKIVIGAVVLFQFGSMLFTGKVNERLLVFGQSLSVYTYQVMRYLTYNSDEKPFPLSSWPKGTEEI